MRLATNRKYRSDREMMVEALANMKKRRADAIKVLIELLGDNEVVGHTLWALRKMNAVEARSAVEAFVKHEEKSFRDEAKKAIAKFDRAASARR